MGHRRRLIGLILGLIALFTLLIHHYFHIQIIEGEKWKRIGDRQHFFEVNEPFIRGSFYANGAGRKTHKDKPEKLVIDLLKYHLFVDPEAIEPRYQIELAEHLGQFLDMPKEKIIGELSKKSRSRKIALWIDLEMRDAILSWWTPFAKNRKIPKNALYFVKDYKRSYPYGKLLGQVLHTIQYQKDETTKQGLPTGGLELYFDSYLKGHMGKRRWMRSPINAYEVGQLSLSPQNGSDIYLTIDLGLQAICEEELAQAARTFQAKSAFATMMDPFTGRILALAQIPSFSPSDYPSYFKDPQKLDITRVKALQDAQEPGSNMKPFTVMLALLANEEMRKQCKAALIDPEEKIACSSGQFPGRSKPVTDTRLHRFLNMPMALQKSSNIYMANIMLRLVDQFGEDWIRRHLTETFGFGHKVGIELPSESAGLVPTPGKKHPNGALEWSKGTPYSLAMGHNILTTNIQLLRAYAVIANGGRLVQPTLVDKISRMRGGKEEILVDHRQRTFDQFPQVLDQKLIDQLIPMMKYTTKPGGTAKRADVPGFTEAGKTSTPKKVIGGGYSEKLYCPCFIGFTPLKKPAFVLIVTLDEPHYGYIANVGLNHHGGTCCAPTFRNIAKRSLEYLGIPPDDPYGYPSTDPRRKGGEPDWAKEVKALQEKYDKWNS